jgi:hypothetical protein
LLSRKIYITEIQSQLKQHFAIFKGAARLAPCHHQFRVLFCVAPKGPSFWNHIYASISFNSCCLHSGRAFSRTIEVDPLNRRRFQVFSDEALRRERDWRNNSECRPGVVTTKKPRQGGDSRE